MEAASVMVSIQLTLFLLMLLGVYVKKKDMMDINTRKKMSDLLVNVILPCSIIASFNQDLSADTLIKSAQVLAISFGIQFLSIFFSKIFYNKIPYSKQIILRYGTICTNAGFLGLTVVGGVYGSQGLFYGSIALIPIRIFLWSAGVSLFTVTDKKDVIKKIVTHPCIVAVFVGFIMMIFGIKLPLFLDKTISSVGNCTTAISMIIIGGILADIDIRTVINKAILYYSAIRLVFLPILVLVILKLLKMDSIVIGVSVLLTAMPMGSFAAVLAEKYGSDAEFASKCVFTSTVLSIATIPFISLMLK